LRHSYMTDPEGAPVLTYGDHTLYETDLFLLSPGQWLNDRLMGFYFDVLEVDTKAASVHYKFVNPDTVMMINFLKAADVKEDLASLALADGDLVVIPINNNSKVDKAGGSHWSLLVWRKSTKSFHSLDSMAPSNEAVALKVALKVAPLVNPSAAPSWTPSVMVEATPRQKNSFDCGVYVLAITRLLTRKSFEQAIRSLSQEITPTAITQFRVDFLSLIERLKLRR